MKISQSSQALIGHSKLQLPQTNVKILTGFTSLNTQFQSMCYEGSWYKVPVGKTAKILGYIVRTPASSVGVMLYTSTAGVDGGAAPAGNSILPTSRANSPTLTGATLAGVDCEGILNATVAAGLYINMATSDTSGNVSVLTLIIQEV